MPQPCHGRMLGACQTNRHRTPDRPGGRRRQSGGSQERRLGMNEAQDIGLAIGLVVAASLALQSALGPAMNGIVEALKGAGYGRNGRAGLLSLGIGTGLGLLAGLLACWQSAG